MAPRAISRSPKIGAKSRWNRGRTKRVWVMLAIPSCVIAMILSIGQARRKLYFHRELYGETEANNTCCPGFFDASRMGAARSDLAGLAASPHRLAGEARYHPLGVWGNCAEDRSGRNRPNIGQ